MSWPPTKVPNRDRLRTTDLKGVRDWLLDEVVTSVVDGICHEQAPALFWLASVVQQELRLRDRRSTTTIVALLRKRIEARTVAPGKDGAG